MASLSQAQKSMLNKARTLGSGSDQVRLDDAACVYLLARIVADLGHAAAFPEVNKPVPAFFTEGDLQSLRIEGHEFMPLIERLCGLDTNADTYFVCLANLHKRRLKYARILRHQPLPSMDQVGPRGLLQYGSLSPRALAALLFWRKWIYDTDNRAAQETGYVFEPIIANAIGGAPFGQSKSPVRRAGDGRKGRQVDCILDEWAYEFKIRVTIAASGQGRWGEELQFPEDCKQSGYTPRLVVLDPTENPKLTALADAFRAVGGEVYIGDEAWQHLDDMAGPTMATFLETYVRSPIARLLNDMPEPLPRISFEQGPDQIVITVDGEPLLIQREVSDAEEEVADDGLPDDADDEVAGP